MQNAIRWAALGLLLTLACSRTEIGRSSVETLGGAWEGTSCYVSTHRCHEGECYLSSDPILLELSDRDVTLTRLAASPMPIPKIYGTYRITDISITFQGAVLEDYLGVWGMSGPATFDITRLQNDTLVCWRWYERDGFCRGMYLHLVRTISAVDSSH